MWFNSLMIKIQNLINKTSKINYFFLTKSENKTHIVQFFHLYILFFASPTSLKPWSLISLNFLLNTIVGTDTNDKVSLTPSGYRHVILAVKTMEKLFWVFLNSTRSFFLHFCFQVEEGVQINILKVFWILFSQKLRCLR